MKSSLPDVDFIDPSSSFNCSSFSSKTWYGDWFPVIADDSDKGPNSVFLFIQSKYNPLRII